MQIEHVVVGIGVTCAALLAHDRALAVESRQGPITISVGAGSGTFLSQGNPLNSGQSDTSVRFPSIDLLYHLDGHSSEINFGLRQDVWFPPGGAMGLTAARGGYDIPLMVAHNKYEITIAPYVLVGIGYGINGAQFVPGVGADGRFYFHANYFGYVRPIELLVHAGNGSYSSYDTALGAGVSF